jgi:hypothetical protein
MDFADLRGIELLNRGHDLQAFHCGVENLDNYLRDRAVSDSEKNLSRIFVLTLKASPNTIVGYYSLSSLVVPIEGLPAAISKKLSYRVIGTTLLGKLAVAEDWQRDRCRLRVGEHLLLHAMLSAWKASQSVASWALVVDVLISENSNPTGFYAKHGFLRFHDSPGKMFLPMATIENTLRTAGVIE